MRYSKHRLPRFLKLAVGALAAAGVTAMPAAAEVPSTTTVIPPVVPSTTSRPAGFDPARHMGLDEVRPGMKGYGVTVILGQASEKFEVEVISIAKNFNPGQDIFIVRVTRPDFQLLGVAQGMSGSPIYLYDSAGKPKLAGALAYGWPFAKEPVTGIQPIENMLSLAYGDNLPPVVADASEGATWRLRDCLKSPPQSPDLLNAPSGDGVTGMQRTARLIYSGNIPRPFMEMMTTRLGLPAGESGAGAISMDTPATAGLPTTRPASARTMKPGDTLIVPLVAGDANLVVLGTATEVIGDRVLGFGHPFLGSGTAELPMANGTVALTVASLNASFKLGSMDDLVGTLTRDTTCGVGGVIGKIPAMTPVTVTVHLPESKHSHTYNFIVAREPQLMALLLQMAVGSATGGASTPRGQLTQSYDVKVELSTGQMISRSNVTSTEAGGTLEETLGQVGRAIFESPFGKLQVAKVTADVTVETTNRTVVLLSGELDKQAVTPGASLRGRVIVRPYRAAEKSMPFEFPLPADMPEGDYTLTIGGGDALQEAAMLADPGRYEAHSFQQQVDVLNQMCQTRNDKLFAFVPTPDATGVQVGKSRMNDLPASRRRVLLDLPGRPTNEIRPLLTRELQSPGIAVGQVQLDFTVSHNPVMAKIVRTKAGASGAGSTAMPPGLEQALKDLP